MKTNPYALLRTFSSRVLSQTAFAALLTFTFHTTKAQSPTAPALDFNVFVQNGAQLKTNETEGPVAMGGDLTLAGNYRVAIKTAGSFKVSNVPIGLLVGGKIVYSSGNQTYVNNGYVKIGNGTGSKVWYTDNNGANANLRITAGNYNSNPNLNLQTSASNLGVSATNNPVVQGGLIDFAAAFATMQTSSTNMSAYASNITLTNPNGDRTGSTIPSVLTYGQLKVTLKTGINVLNVTGAELNSVTSGITFNNGPDASRVLVINVNAPGTFNWSVWNQAGIALQHCPYIIYNFYNTTNLQIQGNSTIEGTVFAPFANITKTTNQSNIEGQIIGLSYNHAGGENHYANFSPSLPNTNVPAVTKPTTGATQPVFTNRGTSSVTFSWTNGNGAGRIVIAQKGGAANAPTDNQVYTANAKFGMGTTVGNGYVVYNGTGNSVTVTNLLPNTQYYFTVVEYNTAGSLVAYNSSLSLTANTATLADTDGDGVPDEDDQYPTDATKAFANYFPASGYGTLLYEDQWPFKGDYDFNDLVIDYRFNTITNAAGKVAQVEYSFVPRASGANYKNGFAFQLDGIHPSKIASVGGTRMKEGWTTLSNNGTEAGQTATNIIVFDNTNTVFNGTPGGILNTYTASPKYSADTIKVAVSFVTDGVSFTDLPAARFNPYLIVNQNRGQEVHLPNYLPSAKMDKSFYGKGDDRSNAATGRYFKTATNLPWALNVVKSIAYPQEKVDITKAYLKFITWATNNGASSSDWYLDNPGNRDASKLYNK